MANNKKTRKPLIYYYIVTLLIVMLLNVFLFPSMKSSQTEEVNYNTFISMLNKNEVKDVKVQDNEIVFTPSDPNNNKI